MEYQATERAAYERARDGLRIERADIVTARKGDVVRFKKYALRIEFEPKHGPGSITLCGRINIDGCPVVTKHFMAGNVVDIERA
jgi:hypothetical protein